MFKDNLKKGYREDYENWQFEQLVTMSRAKNYNRFIFNLVQKYIGSNVLEVGSGLGVLSEKLYQSPLRKLILVEKSEKMGFLLRDKFKDKTKVYINDIFNSVLFKELKSEVIDTIVCFNLLEHIKQDEILIKLFYDLLIENGVLILLVPAFPFLYGAIDRKAGHIKRYKIEALNKITSPLGFDALEMRYINFIGFFTWLFNGRITKRDYVSSTFLKVYDKLMVPLSTFLEKLVKLPFGQSLFCVYRKLAQ